jgi:CrcB protein
MVRVLLVGLGGFLGANARYWLSFWVSRRFGVSFPLATFVINVSGSFVLGLFLTLAARLGLADGWRTFFAVGFVGAYTTFSTFEWETLQMTTTDKMAWERTKMVALYTVGSVVAGFVAVWFGAEFARIIPVTGRESRP